MPVAAMTRVMIDRLSDLLKQHSYAAGLGLAVFAAGIGWLLAGPNDTPPMSPMPGTGQVDSAEQPRTTEGDPINTANPDAESDIAVQDAARLDDGLDRVVLRALDKITARITDLEVVVGESAEFGSLLITVRYCRKRPPEEPPEIFAYLEIDDLRLEENTRVFSGWMMSSSPALHPLEHPVYDIWVINCTIVSADSSSDRR